MHFCTEPMIDGNVLPDLRYSIHARERLEASHQSQAEINRELRAGGFKVVRKFSDKVWKVRQGHIEMILDMIQRVIVTIVLLTPGRVVHEDPKLAAKFNPELVARLTKDTFIRERTQDPKQYTVQFLNLNVIKKIRK